MREFPRRDVSTVETKSLQEVRHCFPLSGTIFDEAECCRQNIVNGVFSQLGNIQSFAQTVALSTAYRPIGNIVLQKMSDGTYSGTLRNEATGEIQKFAKFEKVCPQAVTACSFVFSVGSFAFGQVNMMDISNRLANIAEQLDEAKQREYNEKEAKVKGVCDAFDKLKYLPDEENVRITVILLQKELLSVLMAIKSDILLDIQKMPEITTPKWYENLGLNKEDTKPEKARKRFAYIAKMFPVWCNGMSQLVLSDAYLTKSFNSAHEFVSGLKEIVRNSGLLTKVQLVPMLVSQNSKKVDPVGIMAQVDRLVEETETNFDKVLKQLNVESYQIPIFAADIQKEVNNGQVQEQEL